MAFALTFVGLILIVTGVQDTAGALGSQLKKDFTGDKNFVMYAAAIGGVGALGYVKDLRTFSHYFLALILIAALLSNRGFFTQLAAGLKAAPVAPPASGQGGTSQSPSAINADINAQRPQGSATNWLQNFFTGGVQGVTPGGEPYAIAPIP